MKSIVDAIHTCTFTLESEWGHLLILRRIEDVDKIASYFNLPLEILRMKIS